MMKRYWGYILGSCCVFGCMMTTVAQDISVDQNAQIEQASKRIINIIKNKSDYYQSKFLDILESWRVNFHDEEKKQILGHIEHLVSGYISCQAHNGERVDEYLECEYIDESHCQKMGGQYDACASACRHGNASICLLPCRKVCALK